MEPLVPSVSELIVKAASLSYLFMFLSLTLHVAGCPGIVVGFPILCVRRHLPFIFLHGVMAVTLWMPVRDCGKTVLCGRN